VLSEDGGKAKCTQQAQGYDGIWRMDEEQVQVARKEDLPHALSTMASKFRSRTGESLVTLKEHDKPLGAGDDTIAGGASSIQHRIEDTICERLCERKMRSFNSQSAPSPAAELIS
jgi:hypothetical protein